MEHIQYDYYLHEYEHIQYDYNLHEYRFLKTRSQLLLAGYE